MSLISSIFESIARGRVNGARKGKEGKDMQNVLKALDGKKRYIMLAIIAAQTVASLSGHPIGEGVKVLLSVLGWSEGDSLVPAGQVAQLVGIVWAVVSGLRKDMAAAPKPKES